MAGRVQQPDCARAGTTPGMRTNTGKRPCQMRETSNNTIVGVFDDYSTAENVARELTNAGNSRESIEVKSNFMTGLPAVPGGPARSRRDLRISSSGFSAAGTIFSKTAATTRKPCAAEDAVVTA